MVETSDGSGALTMKIYLFDSETGVYLGEDFTDEAPMCKGRDAVPPDATTIAPPLYRHGEVPVFSDVKNQWEIRPISAAVAGSSGDSYMQANLQSKRQMFQPLR
jgi:hypothetical protein